MRLRGFLQMGAGAGAESESESESPLETIYHLKTSTPHIKDIHFHVWSILPGGGSGLSRSEAGSALQGRDVWRAWKPWTKSWIQAY